jgi:hypothetical protein
MRLFPLPVKLLRGFDLAHPLFFCGAKAVVVWKEPPNIIASAGEVLFPRQLTNGLGCGLPQSFGHDLYLIGHAWRKPLEGQADDAVANLKTIEPRFLPDDARFTVGANDLACPHAKLGSEQFLALRIKHGPQR